MTTIPLILGPLAPDGWRVRRSGLRWLIADGETCAQGRVLAYCNISVSRGERVSDTHPAFTAERRDLQVGFVARLGGRVTLARDASRGGLLDLQEYVFPWRTDFAIGAIDTGDAVPDDPSKALGLLFAAGRRIADHAEVRGGFLTGWYASCRAWIGDEPPVGGTLLSLGTCELTAAMRGERPAFAEFLWAQPGATQVVSIPDHLLVPCARVTLEQLSRTTADIEAITADFARTFPVAARGAAPDDWIVAGTLLAALCRNPLDAPADVLTRGGIQPIARPDAVVMSLLAEPRTVFRHRALGYTVCMHDFRVAELRETTRSWLRARFEPVSRDPSDIQRDWRALIDAARVRWPMRFLALNVRSSNAEEDFLSYAQFDAPMHRVIGSVHGKEMNLMLHDLAAERDIDIVDVDAIVAELGVGRHMPDGTHLSGEAQAMVRDEISRILAARGVPGFRRPSAR